MADSHDPRPCARCDKPVSPYSQFEGISDCSDTQRYRGSISNPFVCPLCREPFLAVYCEACLNEDFWARD